MNIDKVEKPKYILLIEILLVIIVITFIGFIFSNKEESIKESNEEKLDIKFLSVIGKEMFNNVKYIEVYNCLEKYDDYYTSCKKSKIVKIEDLNKISEIIDKIDNISPLDIVEELPSNLSTKDLKGRYIIDIYYKDSTNSQLIFLNNYLQYTINKPYGISQTYYNYGNSSANNYVKTIK